MKENNKGSFFNYLQCNVVGRSAQLFLNFIWRAVCYDKNDSNNFRFKVVRSFFDEDEIQFKYSTNKGITWNYIYECVHIGYTIDFDYTWKKLTIPIYYNIEYIKSKFPNYKIIKEHQENEMRKYIEGNKSIREQRKEYYDRKKKENKHIQDRINKLNERKLAVTPNEVQK